MEPWEWIWSIVEKGGIIGLLFGAVVYLARQTNRDRERLFDLNATAVQHIATTNKVLESLEERIRESR